MTDIANVYVFEPGDPRATHMMVSMTVQTQVKHRFPGAAPVWEAGPMSVSTLCGISIPAQFCVYTNAPHLVTCKVCNAIVKDREAREVAADIQEAFDP